MKLAALLSGGKESVRALEWALKQGFDVKYLVTIFPERRDSWMFHTATLNLIELSSRAVGIELIGRKSSGIKEKELQDLKEVLSGLDIEGVVCGSLASNYQRERVEKICKELALNVLLPFWNYDPEKFVKEIIDSEYEVIITSVSSAGLDKSWLGRKLDYDALEELKKLNEKFGVHICGEGGEYESFVCDAPIFKKRIEIVDSEIVWEGISGFLEVKKAILVEK